MYFYKMVQNLSKVRTFPEHLGSGTNIVVLA